MTDDAPEEPSYTVAQLANPDRAVRRPCRKWVANAAITADIGALRRIALERAEWWKASTAVMTAQQDKQRRLSARHTPAS